MLEADAPLLLDQEVRLVGYIEEPFKVTSGRAEDVGDLWHGSAIAEKRDQL